MPRFLIASGTQHYPDPAAELDQVPAELARIEDLFVKHAGYRAESVNLRADPRSQPLRQGLERWLKDPGRTDEDVVVIYYTGHGFARDTKHFLATADTEPSLVTTAVSTDELISIIGSDAAVRRILLIIDVCYAGQGARDLIAAAQRSAAHYDQQQPEDNEGIWIITSARARDEAQQVVFTEALQRAYDALAASTPPSQTHLSFELLFAHINNEFKDRGIEQRAGFLATSPVQGLPPFLPNPRFDPNDPTAKVYADNPAAADVVAQSPAKFVGRTSALAVLSSQSSGDPVHLVTGRAGTGKSALLAELGQHAADRPTIAVDAYAKTGAGLAHEVEQKLGVRLDALATLTDPVRVIVDGLDTAAEPAAITFRVLSPLAAAGVDAVHLVIGCRTDSVPTMPFDVKVVDLDSETNNDVVDLVEFIAGWLRGTHPAADADATRSLAAAVAHRADGNFALALTIAATLNASDALPTAAEFGAAAPLSFAAAFAEDLSGWGGDEARVRDLLTPLAWARGSGLPWETLWVPLANALSTTSIPYGDADIEWLLKHARRYLLETQTGGRAVFRLYHEELAGYLRAQSRLPAGDVDAAIVAAVLARVPTDADGTREWLGAPRYALEHLPAHAAAAHALDELLTDPAFLVAGDVDALLSVLSIARSLPARRAAGVYAIASDRLRSSALTERASVLGLVAHQQGEHELAAAFTRLAGGAGWVSRWADWAPAVSHRTLLRASTMVMSMAGAGGGLVAVGEEGGTLRVIDVATGRVRLESRLAARVTALAWLNGDHPWQLAAGDSGGGCYLWEALDAPPVHFAAHHSDVRAITELRLADHWLLVTAGVRGEMTGTIRSWRADGLDPAGPEFDAFLGRVWSLSALEVDGVSAILAAGDPLPARDRTAAGQLRVFDVLTGAMRDDVSIDPHGWAHAAEVDGTHVLLSCGESVERWDVVTKQRIATRRVGRVVAPVSVHDDATTAMVAIGGWGEVEFVDVDTLQQDYGQIPNVFVNHIASVAVAGGHTLVASTDYTVDAWDPPIRTDGRRARPAESVGSLRSGVVAVREPGTLEVRDAGSGELFELAEPRDDLTGLIATCRHDGLDIVFAAAVRDGLVRQEIGGTRSSVRWQMPARVTAVTAHIDAGTALTAVATITTWGDAAVQLRDAETGDARGVALHSDKTLGALAFARLGGRLVLAAGGAGRELIAWDVEEVLSWRPEDHPMHDTLPSTRLQKHADWVRSIAVAEIPGRDGLLLSAGDDMTLYGIDLASGAAAFRLKDAHPDWIFAIGTGVVRGRSIVATGDRRGTLRVWSLADRPVSFLYEVALDTHINSIVVADNAVFVATRRGLISIDLRG